MIIDVVNHYHVLKSFYYKQKRNVGVIPERSLLAPRLPGQPCRRGPGVCLTGTQGPAQRRQSCWGLHPCVLAGFPPAAETKYHKPALETAEVCPHTPWSGRSEIQAFAGPLPLQPTQRALPASLASGAASIPDLRWRHSSPRLWHHVAPRLCVLGARFSSLTSTRLVQGQPCPCFSRTTSSYLLAVTSSITLSPSRVTVGGLGSSGFRLSF